MTAWLAVRELLRWNWTGSILVAPRTKLGNVAQRDEVKGTGVYVLVGDSDVSSSRKKIYVGEADTVIGRLREHARSDKKAFWSDTIVIASKDQNLTKAHARFLESHLIRAANESGRAEVENGTKGTSLESITLPESDISDMTEFLDQVRLVLPVVGFDFLEPSVTTKLAQNLVEPTDAPIFELKQSKFHATAREIDGKFVVLKGSIARSKPQPSWTLFKKGGAELVRDGKLVKTDDDDCLLFTEDIPFSSPSSASASVLARNDNGRQSWKVSGSGIPYQEWFLAQIDDSTS